METRKSKCLSVRSELLAYQQLQLLPFFCAWQYRVGQSFNFPVICIAVCTQAMTYVRLRVRSFYTACNAYFSCADEGQGYQGGDQLFKLLPDLQQGCAEPVVAIGGGLLQFSGTSYSIVVHTLLFHLDLCHRCSVLHVHFHCMICWCVPGSCSIF